MRRRGSPNYNPMENTVSEPNSAAGAEFWRHYTFHKWHQSDIIWHAGCATGKVCVQVFQVVCKPWMSVQRFMPIHAVEVEIFHWIHDNFDLLVGLKEKSGGHQGREVSPLGKHLGVMTWLSRHFSKTQTFIQSFLSCIRTSDKLFYLYEGGFVFTCVPRCSVGLSGNTDGFSPNLDEGWVLNFGVKIYIFRIMHGWKQSSVFRWVNIIWFQS